MQIITQQKLQNRKISTVLFIAVLMFFSVVLLVVNVLYTSGSGTSYTLAKTMGQGWKNYLSTASAPLSENGDNIVTTSNHEVIGLNDLYSKLFPANSSSMTTGIINEGKDSDGNNIAPRLRKITEGANAGLFTYCITISTAYELMAFGTLSAGYHPGVINIGNANDTLMNFFRSANYKLGNNINYKGNSKYVIKNGGATTEKYIGIPLVNYDYSGLSVSFTSNGSYFGYGEMYENNPLTTSNVVFPFIPVQNFAGVFDGQNFDVSNLSILRNNKVYATNANYDAFFANINSDGSNNSGLVRNFGLTNVYFVQTSLSYDLSVADYKPTAGICGENGGTIKYVYCTNATVTTGQGTWKTVGLNNGILTSYYSGDAALINSDGSAVTGTDGNQVYLESGEGQGITFNSNDERWYSSNGNARFENAAHDIYNSIFSNRNDYSYKLCGLKVSSMTSGQQDFSIRTVADFVTFTHVAKEGFTRISNHQDSVNAKGAVFVKIENNLNFDHVGKTSIIPILDLSAAPTKIVLFSSNSAGIVDFSQRKSLYNLTINAFIDQGKALRMYGIFSTTFDTAISEPIGIYNLNLVDNYIKIASEVILKVGSDLYPSMTEIKGKNTAAGLLVGSTRRPLDISGVATNGKIEAFNQDYTAGPNGIGGIVGWLHDIGSTTIGKKSGFTSVCFSGEINAASRIVNGWDNQTKNNRYGTGGIVGISNVTVSDASSAADNVMYNNVYVGGDIYGLLAIDRINSGSGPINCVGGIIGYGNSGGSAFDSLNSVYIDANIYSFKDSYIEGQPYFDAVPITNISANVGGFIGEWGAKNNQIQTLDLGCAYGTECVQDHSSIKIDGNIISNFAIGNPNNTASYAINTGAIAGSATNVNIKNLKTSHFFSGQFLNLDGTARRTAGGQCNLNIGNIFGLVQNCSFENITNDKSIEVIGKFNVLNVAGVAGNSNTNDSSSKSFLNVTNSGSIIIIPYTPNINTAVVKTAGIFAATSTNGKVNLNNCHNTAAITVKAPDGETNGTDFSVRGQVVISGLIIYSNSNSGDTISNSSNSGTLMGKIFHTPNNNIDNNFQINGIAQNGMLIDCVNSGDLYIENLAVNANYMRLNGLLNSGDATRCVNSAEALFTVKKAGKRGNDLTVAGIGYDLNNVESCKNYADINVSNLFIASDFYLTGLAVKAVSMENCENYGNITTENFTANKFLVGGIFASTAMNAPDANGSMNYKNNVNYGIITANACQGIISAGGIGAYIQANIQKFYFEDNFNFGNVSINCPLANSDISIGGIVGETSNFIGFNRCINNAEVNAVTGSAKGGVGGIFGQRYYSDSAGLGLAGALNDCYNLGNILVSSGTTSSSSISVGGIGGRITILYNASFDSGNIASIQNSVNSGDISLNITSGTNASEKGSGVGGIVGNIKDTYNIARNINIFSVLNYGNIVFNGFNKLDGWGAGGILGVATEAARINIKGAVNYGEVSSPNTSGGILGNADSTVVKIDLNDVVSYGKLTGANSYGLVGGNESPSVNIVLQMGIYVDPNYGNFMLFPANSITVNGNYAYLSNSSISGSISLNELYSENFVLAPGANEIAYYGRKDTVSSTLVWSEHPFESAGVYHTNSAAASGKVFALTTTQGRRAGVYLGDNYEATVINSVVKNSAKSSELIYNLSKLKQIKQSRDTYVNYFEVKNGVETLKEFILIDNDASKTFNSLPTLSFVSSENQFSTVILSDSSYYGENIKNNNFSFNGNNVRLKNYSAFFTDSGKLPMFSQNSKLYTGAGYNSIADMSGFKIVSSKTVNFKTNGTVNDVVTPVTIATLETIIYQGDWNGNNAQWLEKYATTYSFEVIFYKANPSFIMDLSGDYGNLYNFYLSQKSGIYDENETATLLYTDPLQPNDEEIVYKFQKSTDKSLVDINWAASRFGANFTLSEIDIDAFNLNLKTNFYIKENGAYKLLNVPNYLYFYYTHHTNPLEPIFIPDANIFIQRFQYSFNCVITNPLSFKELTGGEYRIELALDLPDKSFKRIFEFNKEKSGDVFLHENNGTADDVINNLITPSSSKAFRIPFVELFKMNNTNANPVRYIDANNVFNSYNTINKDVVSGKTNYTFGFEQTIVKNFPVNGEYYGAILSPYFLDSFGVLGAFLPTDHQNSSLFTFSHLLPKDNSLMPLPTPNVEFRLSEDGTMADIILTYIVYAENGDSATYRYVYKYHSLPDGKVNLYNDSNVLYEGTKVNIAKTGSLNISVGHTFPNTRFSTKDFMQVNYTDILYTLDSTIENYKIGRLTFSKDELGNYSYVLDKTVEGENIDFPSFEIVAEPDNVNSYRLKVKFDQNTSSGIFNFVPTVQYALKCYSYGSSESPVFPSYVTLKAFDGTVLNEFQFSPYVAQAQMYSFEKQASRNAYLNDIGFSTNIPSGGFLQYYNYDPNNSSYKLEGIGGLTSVKNDNINLSYFDGVSVDKYVNPDLTDLYLSPLRANSFRVLVTFPNAIMQGFSDYSTWMSLKLWGETHPIVPDEYGKVRRYNDEYAEAYLLTKNSSGDWIESDTPLPKVTVYKTDEQGNQIVDYQTIELYLPESSLVRVRVRAGNPLFFNDYEFISDGPLKNKNFNIKIEAPKELENMVFVIYLKVKVGDKTIRTLNFLFKTSDTANDFDAVLNPDTGQFEKFYLSTYNVTGRYELSLMSMTAGYEADLMVTGAPELLDFTYGNNYFLTKTELPATYDITIKIKGSGLTPPWGDQIFD